MLRRALWTALFSTVIAAVIAMLRETDFWISMVYSCAIGLICWLLIDGSRLLLAHHLARSHPERPEFTHGWPGWGPMLGVLLVGSPLGYLLGSMLARWLTGSDPHPGHQHSSDGYFVMLLVTLGIGATLTRIQYAKGQLAHAQAQAEAQRRQLAETQLRLLQSQLEPHMLFNTLANLRVLITLDPPRAQAMLDHLIAFLRATLKASRQAGSHRLAEEFERIGDYLALMAMRMGPRLHVEFDLPAELRELPVPALLLQPLVENAIRHGLEPRPQGGTVRVSAQREDTDLVLTVRDDGAGLAAPATMAPLPAANGGFGLTQVRERLQTLYGERARFDLAIVAQGGTLATLRLPLDR